MAHDPGMPADPRLHQEGILPGQEAQDLGERHVQPIGRHPADLVQRGLQAVAPEGEKTEFGDQLLLPQPLMGFGALGLHIGGQHAGNSTRSPPTGNRLRPGGPVAASGRPCSI